MEKSDTEQNLPVIDAPAYSMFEVQASPTNSWDGGTSRFVMVASSGEEKDKKTTTSSVEPSQTVPIDKIEASAMKQLEQKAIRDAFDAKTKSDLSEKRSHCKSEQSSTCSHETRSEYNSDSNPNDKHHSKRKKSYKSKNKSRESEGARNKSHRPSPTKRESKMRFRPERNAECRTARTLCICGLNPSIQASILEKYFSSYGTIININIANSRILKNSRPQATAFVNFMSSKSVDKVQASRPHVIDGKIVNTQRTLPLQDRFIPYASKLTPCVNVHGLSDTVTTSKLKTYLSMFGTILDINVSKDGRSAAVRFDDYDPADILVLEENHKIGGQSIKILKIKDEARTNTTKLPDHELDKDMYNKQRIASYERRLEALKPKPQHGRYVRPPFRPSSVKSSTNTRPVRCDDCGEHSILISVCQCCYDKHILTPRSPCFNKHVVKQNTALSLEDVSCANFMDSVSPCYSNSGCKRKYSSSVSDSNNVREQSPPITSPPADSKKQSPVSESHLTVESTKSSQNCNPRQEYEHFFRNKSPPIMINSMTSPQKEDRSSYCKEKKKKKSFEKSCTSTQEESSDSDSIKFKRRKVKQSDIDFSRLETLLVDCSKYVKEKVELEKARDRTCIPPQSQTHENIVSPRNCNNFSQPSISSVNEPNCWDESPLHPNDETSNDCLIEKQPDLSPDSSDKSSSHMSESMYEKNFKRVNNLDDEYLKENEVARNNPLYYFLNPHIYCSPEGPRPLAMTRSYTPYTEPARSYTPYTEPARSYTPYTEPARSYTPYTEPARSYSPYSEPVRSYSPYPETTSTSRTAEFTQSTSDDDISLRHKLYTTISYQLMEENPDITSQEKLKAAMKAYLNKQEENWRTLGQENDNNKDSFLLEQPKD